MNSLKDRAEIMVCDDEIIFIDGLLGDYSSLNTVIENSDCIFNFASLHAYESIRLGLAEYLFDKEPTRIIHEKISLIEDQWKLYNSL